MQNVLQESQTSGNDWHPLPSAMAYQSLQQAASKPESHAQKDVFDDFERQMALFETEHDQSVAELRKCYVFPADHSVTTCLKSYRAIPHILLSAVSHLEASFGSNTVFALRVSAEELGSQIIFAVALWPDSASVARAALKQFDEAWWIANAHEASGYLNFTYELV